MRYRIRYENRNEQRTAEIEAPSPEAAVVKFQHSRPRDEKRGQWEPRVVSVSRAEPEEPEW